MQAASNPLREILAAEHAAPVPGVAQRLADAIRRRHAGAARAVVYYGSCLRDANEHGIHDFYLVVDDYRSAYASRGLAVANALLPPNVFYLEECHDGGVARAKVAVVSGADLRRGCSAQARRVGLWARFAQPVALAWARDAAARQAVVDASHAAVLTAIRAALSLGGGEPGWQHAAPDRLWPRVFDATYASELRPERTGAGSAIHAVAPERYAAALAFALDALERQGIVELDRTTPTPRVRLLRRERVVPRPAVAKALAAATLAKSGVTFGDWLPYALWKLERHSGLHLEPTPRQRRHPWIFGWPLVFRALRSGALR